MARLDGVNAALIAKVRFATFTGRPRLERRATRMVELKESRIDGG
jgi:hypothetical protein